MDKKAIIFKLGAIDRFTSDPFQMLTEQGLSTVSDVIEVDNLAELVLKKGNSELMSIFEAETDFICCASRPRTARALLDFGGIEFRSRKITWMPVAYDKDALKREHGTPWFPVIDRERCTGCGICYDYCLFSTYGRNDSLKASERIQVENPLNCKIGCPACARLCKSNAVIFPFNPEPELNGALDEIGPQMDNELLKAFEADPIKVLAERRRKRQLLKESKFVVAERD